VNTLSCVTHPAGVPLRACVIYYIRVVHPYPVEIRIPKGIEMQCCRLPYRCFPAVYRKMKGEIDEIDGSKVKIIKFLKIVVIKRFSYNLLWTLEVILNCICFFQTYAGHASCTVHIRFLVGAHLVIILMRHKSLPSVHCCRHTGWVRLCSCVIHNKLFWIHYYEQRRVPCCDQTKL